MSILESAAQFFDACETGQGWQRCRQWCVEAAGFSAQADALAETTTLRDYCDWMQSLQGPIPDARYEMKAMALDAQRNTVLAFAVFHGTNTGDGPVPATGKSCASDYVYAIVFEGDKISHMTKIWNDGIAMRQMGWG